MVQGQDRHHVVERTSFGELLEPHTPEDRAFGCPRVDRGHEVAGASEGTGQPPLSATHLQHAGRRVTNLLKDELLDALLPPLGLTYEVHTHSFSFKNAATTTPERKVSSPTEPTAHEMPNMSAMMPAESAPTA